MPPALDATDLKPLLMPLGDRAVLVRFADYLSEDANSAAIAFACRLEAEPIAGVVEIVPNLVSLLVRYAPEVSSYDAVAGELRLRLRGVADQAPRAKRWRIPVRFDGPDMGEVAELLGLVPDMFVARHNASCLRVLSTGFAPGFVYCGMHPPELVVQRRLAVRPIVPAGSVLFAAGQTAIAATEMPTGWHVIGYTDFRNFDPQAEPPTQLSAGDLIDMEAA